MKALLLTLGMAMLPSAIPAADPAYVGSAACAKCHREIAASQSHSNMALTWHGATTLSLPTDYSAQFREGPAPEIEYRLSRKQDRFTFEVKLPGRDTVALPVETIVGGRRHGLSFLARLTELGGVPLTRPALVETRYLHGAAENRLALSAGFPPEKPSSYETALGRVLSPGFEKKCLACHGLNTRKEVNESGVRCEACHGPGAPHLAAIAQGGKGGLGIVNPARLTHDQSLEICAQCHSGFSRVADPLPDDLLISNQVAALENSECFIQSGHGLSCRNCHDPHQNATASDALAVKACLSCHGAQVANRAALCPVNRKDQCIGCHMPEVTKGSFRMADHWIRVHPEQGVAVPAAKAPEWRTRRPPLRELLWLIVVGQRAAADDIRRQLDGGAPFFDLAGRSSTDSSAADGGFVGPKWLKDMDPQSAAVAARLAPGELSPVLEVNGRFTILRRTERDFLWHAGRAQEEAARLKTQGKLAEAAAKNLEALRIYPHFLRALIFLAVSRGEAGEGALAAGILEYATRLHPDDAPAWYNLGIAYGALGRSADEIAAYRKAIALEPDIAPAYLNLGAALLTAGQAGAAIQTFQQGLEINPLSAQISYNLSLALEQQGKPEAARHALALASAVDPEFVRRQQQAR